MDTSTLNPQQKAAVETMLGPSLILAGAGSGKTRVLTYRIAQLIEQGAALPGEILALTFTNKAAKEMKIRVAKLLCNTLEDKLVDNIWISTFHSSGARWLRQYAEFVNLDPGFVIYDDADQKSLIKDCMKRLNISDKVVAPKAVAWKINALKNEGKNPKDFNPGAGAAFFDRKVAPLLRLYQERLEENNAVDFGDLLLKSYELFKNNEELCDAFQDRYRFVLVDEYQDTNPVQYEILRLLTKKYRNFTVVGDEDQSIYKWRGADIRNILDFEKDFPEAKIFKLEENYRSTANIIRAASKVIANNKERKEKELFTKNADGESVEVHYVKSDFDESRFVTKEIKKLIDSGISASDIAIFYRTHAQSRLLEDSLRYERLPYRIFGGLKFYDRAEIKDAMAYMRLIVNLKDDVSFYRIINTPARGIGKTTIDKVRDFASFRNVPALEAASLIMDPEEDLLGAATKKKIKVFLQMYTELQDKLRDYPPQDFYAYLLERSGYIDALRKDDSIEAQTKLENLKELASAIGDYEQRNDEPSIIGFLEEVSLLTDYDRTQNDDVYVTMMTLHSAKGLEFHHVFMVGLEEGLFPKVKFELGSEVEEIEEERRLCYVGMTRARQKLTLSSARLRKVFGQTQVQNPSRFIEEMPQDEIRIVEHAPREQRAYNFGGASRSSEFDQSPQYDSNFYSNDTGNDFGFESQVQDDDESPLKVGVKVHHPDFGRGVIVQRSGRGQSLKVSVRFERLGTKKFIARFAPLEPLPS